MKRKNNSKTAESLKNEIARGKPVFWANPAMIVSDVHDLPQKKINFTRTDIDEAEARLERFAPYIETAFPETRDSNGIIESPLKEIHKMKNYLLSVGEVVQGNLFLKCDSHLPISGSVKARGGIYEVLKYAEELALDAGLIKKCDNYSRFADDDFKKFFSGYSVAVGSTGNLGMSIGIISAKLGFKVDVHMSQDAKDWKKELLRRAGVNVVEYSGDYEKAVAEGRKLAEADPKCHFVDDENSQDLFLGYAVAGRRLAKQLRDRDISVSEATPLFVYIPCGVGGAPGGIAFGIKDEFGDNAHIYFAEPVQAPAMTLGLVTGLYEKISAQDVGLSGKTEADGLAVSRPSALVSPIMAEMLDGCFTVEDEELYPYLTNLAELEDIWVEPSACAAFPGPGIISENWDGLEEVKANHIIWATGGSAVPEDIMQEYYRRGKNKENFNGEE
ncbi:MAG: D-serine ammonia-lyase [Clostridiales bacterium]|nr:D-serine ammonia-lyase [Clostridiales bacterium]MDD7347051.1 D-serine ammonia-lyase [Clostridiales bacterium]MDY4060277.1 D-serine ammonia-lyase [Anaerovoracaceae bacterium]